ncbi:M20/M25/M40 family metallo-hydrolase [Tepidiforma bonchosmolovskayae]|uniref:M20/M25/M40 family metallo-hydrolase n=1 Tax=Tepidiforma bonchosmolovskayae TaxID=2601677 RepID=A0ABX6C170_9CHLR|nr:M20/M25/M40 family metallo-hydrolase [Tepidiforma bonchosmolovskayae]QFG02574.1 M20/M25/M40 family metallo-hydrolase [Tepidiforma bonchosmolovskayae]
MAIDWPAVHREALEILVQYLQIDTSNPPGNEKPAARFLGAISEAEGIPVEYIETAPNREVLVARLRGDGSKRPIMLCNHTDVVPVEEQYWSVPAFAGLVQDGRVYGRGAVDMKGCGVMQLMAMLLLKREGVPLKRDVVFCAVPDEEAGSDYGMAWLCEHRPDIVDVEYELSEGAGGTTRFGRQETRLFSVATNEKDICWLKLTAVGRPGHGSVPHEDNSAVYLVRALKRLVDWERPLVFTPDTEAYLDRLAEAGLMPPRSDRKAVEERIRRSPELLAMFQNTLNLTMLQAGIKANVIPARSEAVIDCRLLPGQSKRDWIRQVRERIGDERVSVELLSPDHGEPEAVPWDTELFRTITSVVKEAMEDAVVVPGMTIGGTDNRFLRERGIPAYGFIPCLLSPEERRGFHGNDEFLTVENLNLGCELMYEIVRRMVS